MRARLPLAVITNGAADTQREKINVDGLKNQFTAIVISAELGVAKPDPAIFQFALDRVSFPPEAVWHVGDSLQSDVAGAKAVGLTAIWLNRHGSLRVSSDPEPDLEIASLSELLALLAEEGESQRGH
jgi:FMN phosphatase YigB (HAD superfamily)